MAQGLGSIDLSRARHHQCHLCAPLGSARCALAGGRRPTHDRARRMLHCCMVVRPRSLDRFTSTCPKLWKRLHTNKQQQRRRRRRQQQRRREQNCAHKEAICDIRRVGPVVIDAPAGRLGCHSLDSLSDSNLTDRVGILERVRRHIVDNIQCHGTALTNHSFLVLQHCRAHGSISITQHCSVNPRWRERERDRSLARAYRIVVALQGFEDLRRRDRAKGFSRLVAHHRVLIELAQHLRKRWYRVRML